MIEPNIAELWARAQARASRWDAAAARAELRALGLNPLAPPPDFGEQMSASREDSCALGPRLRGDDEEDGNGGEDGDREDKGDDEEKDGDDDLSSFVTPAKAGAQEDVTAPAALGSPVRADDAVKARAPRHSEWTRAKMAGFLRELAACQNVSQAARSVGMGRQSAYKLRNRLPGTPFALAWEVALEHGFAHLAHAMMDRALNGEAVPVYYHGELVGTRRKFDNKLARWLLENPWKIGRKQIARDFAADEWDLLLDQVEFGTDYEFAPTPESEAELEALMTDEQREQLAHPAARVAAKSWYLQNPPAPPRRGGR